MGLSLSKSSAKQFSAALVLASSIWGVLPLTALAQSQVTSTVPGTEVDPAEYNIFLDTGDPLVVSVTVNVPLEAAPSKLDLFLLEDLSGSFANDLPIIRNLVPNLISEITALVPDTQFGVGSFIDKPINPFGSAFNGDYVYQTELALTSNQASFQSAINGLSTGSGVDVPEAQLEALLQTGVRGASEIGFRSDAFSVVVLSTDAVFHQAGDGVSAGILTPNDGDADLEGTPPGTAEDYPSVEQVKQALQAANVVPIFAVTSSVRSTYEDLVSKLGFGSVVTLSSDSSNLVNAISTGLSDIFTNISLIAVGDDFGYVKSINPPSFADVAPGESVVFDVTFTSDGSGSDDTLRLVAAGFGETVANIDVLDEDGGSGGVTVPEPASILGLLAFGGLGATRLRQRQ
ncbi:MAG: PEP-CTERM sorting domain-containing protein [Leptolyngbyaceae cyanobacterium SM1_1_3]|nr:PEP-CTERM sorting domain-containing protein [Leptolyngbyaceae cyanobacterium SM1_1_3]NJM85798.1 PEP-CTERM sorting domain-containing protein [Leptolyngbyaceae cyanobacterium RM2_2_21]NJN02247.1 PEP-CTERM sorting domain-containing protein [Leptolyngbyaceae cyanobacterium RM1_1_2]NJO08472.1 PEP-CTERM sorting domain-containing protein [Leptolyngbyaceae cyanobacterium SL_1_1]